MTNQYHATARDIRTTGFYFRTYDEYVEKASNHKINMVSNFGAMAQSSDITEIEIKNFHYIAWGGRDIY